MLRPSPNHGTQRLPNEMMMKIAKPWNEFSCFPLYFFKHVCPYRDAASMPVYSILSEV